MAGGTLPPIELTRAVTDLRALVGAWRRQGLTIGLVPTMGALHDGHLALIKRALATADRVCVSLFVNPTQFGPNEDFNVYPRDEAGDVLKVGRAGAHVLFAPTVAEMYPAGSVTRVTVPGLGEGLEGKFRPGFFTGVATVVTKLLLQVMPDVAMFGEKDYQQLLVIRRVAADLNIPVAIAGAPTIREADGLAMSSRNAYLDAGERAKAPALYREISGVAQRVAHGADPTAVCEEAVANLSALGFAPIDYLVVRDAETLQEWAGPSRPGRVLVAARLGRTRLIDNVPVA